MVPFISVRVDRHGRAIKHGEQVQFGGNEALGAVATIQANGGSCVVFALAPLMALAHHQRGVTCGANELDVCRLGPPFRCIVVMRAVAALQVDAKTAGAPSR